MTEIKEFRPSQQILLPYQAGTLLRAESFTVGMQGVVSISVESGEVAVVRDDPKGVRQRLVYSPVGVTIYAEPTPEKVWADAAAADPAVGGRVAKPPKPEEERPLAAPPKQDEQSRQRELGQNQQAPWRSGGKRR